MAFSVFRALVIKSCFACCFFVGCMSRYQTSYGEYRPENPKFKMFPNRTIKQLESEKFEIVFAFDTVLPSVPGPYYRDILLFSKDQRFAAIAMIESERNRVPLIISDDPWLTAYQVGFFALHNDTVEVEYFTNFQGGQYHTFKGVLSDNGKTLNIFQHYQGLGKVRNKMNAPHRAKLKRVRQVEVRY